MPLHQSEGRVPGSLPPAESTTAARTTPGKWELQAPAEGGR
eukprot:CAMPEP_0173391588 /NCGR_PEP_ID=MMETSP1356-20130122/18471_1 /TAXON_ID=77927 ORGANISM="Hemiselmis virescens, Strain PCC157" /NCGR_SAMPLE_ID=MMETSP1356 /ASSEMBLY_ACC=CAM_ASM_000847 /LENGTH=40 /DNA_ID= /DNA_START= /DNA_END= /DNA_ORIENTATION=